MCTSIIVIRIKIIIIVIIMKVLGVLIVVEVVLILLIRIADRVGSMRLKGLLSSN